MPSIKGTLSTKEVKEVLWQESCGILVHLVGIQGAMTSSNSPEVRSVLPLIF